MPQIALSQIINLGILEDTTLDLRRTDSLLVFMQPNCPDSIKIRDMLGACNFTRENNCNVTFVNVLDNGKRMSESFDTSHDVYPSYSSSFYEKLSDDDHTGTLLPKVYKQSLGGEVSGCYYRNHGINGLKSIQFDQ